MNNRFTTDRGTFLTDDETIKVLRTTSGSARLVVILLGLKAGRIVRA